MSNTPEFIQIATEQPEYINLGGDPDMAITPSACMCPLFLFTPFAGFAPFLDSGRVFNRSVRPLAAGTISANGTPTTTTVPLIVSAARGGVGAKTLQWYRGTSPGFTPGGGNIVAGATSSTFTDTGRTPNTNYYYKVVWTDQAPASVTSAEYHAITASSSALAAGTISSNGTNGPTTVPLVTTAASGGTSPYTQQWYRSTSSGFTPGVGTIVGGATALTFTDSGRAPDTDYYYKVVFQDALSATATSVEFHAHTAAILVAGTISAGGSPTTTTVPLIASDATGGVAPYTYQWYRSTSSGFTPGPGNILAGKITLTITDTGLSPGTDYYYKLVYTDALPQAATSAEYHAVTAPALAAGLISSNGTPTAYNIFLIATAATGGTAPYTYQWRRSLTSEGTYANIGGATNLTLSNGGLSPSTNYFYKIVATDAALATATSAEYHGVTDIPLTSGVISSNGTPGTTTVPVISTAATGGTHSYTYQWFRDTTPGFTPGVGNTVAGATSLTLNDTGLSPGTNYYYIIRSGDMVGLVLSAEYHAVTASGAAPVANFSGTPLSGVSPLSVVFTDLSTNTPTSWLWEKNDGSGWVNFAGTPTAQNPTEVFTNTAPVAAFSGTPLSGTSPLTVVFTDASTGTPTSWHWEKNDGGGWVDFDGTPTAQNPTEDFDVGTWSIRLTATNAGGSDPEVKTNYVSAGVALTAGVISSNGSVTAYAIPLVTTEATGGTGPYTRQWYRSTSPGFTPGGGNILAGQTNLTLNDTGRSPATDYYYKVVYTDAVLATVTSAEYHGVTGAALAAGSVSANGSPTTTTIPVIATNSTGGSLSYTYQWYRSTSSGFTPGGGNIVGGATSLTFANTGLSAGTDYYMVIRYNDGTTTADSTEYHGVTASSGLTAGAISWNGVPGATSIPLVATDATGGTAPYTYQWYRDVVAGFTPSGANDIPGATSLTLSDTGLTPDQDYYYKIKYTDNVVATATATEFYASVPTSPFADTGEKYVSNPVYDSGAANNWDTHKIYIAVRKIGSTIYCVNGCVSDAEQYNAEIATSSDGISFTKPNQGNRVFDGNDDNNIIGGPNGVYATGWDYDAGRPTGQKYLLLCEQDHNSPIATGVVVYGSETALGVYAAINQVYVNAEPTDPPNYRESKGIRKLEDGSNQIMAFYEIGQLVTPVAARSIGAFLSASSDASGGWSDLGVLDGLEALDGDNQFYWIGEPLWYGGKWIAGVGRYIAGTGKIQLDLFQSDNDLMTAWTLVAQNWIPFGSGVTWDSKIMWGSDFVFHGGEWRAYYAGGDGLHDAFPYGSNIGFAVVQPQPLLLGAVSTLDVQDNSIELTIAAASGGNGYWAYQWYVDDVLVSGATTQTYTFTGLDDNTEYVFKCRVTSGVVVKYTADYPETTTGTFDPSVPGGLVVGLEYTAASTGVSVGDPVVNVTSAWVGGQVATQADSSKRGTLRSDGLELDASNDVYGFTQVDLGTGDFTAYLAGTVAAVAGWCPLNGGNNTMLCYLSGGNFYFINDSGGDKNQAFPGTGPAIPSQYLIRVRRVSGVIHMAWTSKAESSPGSQAGNALWDTIGSGSSGRNGSTSHRYKGTLLYNSDLSGANQTLVEAWIATNWGAGYVL